MSRLLQIQPFGNKSHCGVDEVQRAENTPARSSMTKLSLLGKPFINKCVLEGERVAISCTNGW